MLYRYILIIDEIIYLRLDTVLWGRERAESSVDETKLGCVIMLKMNDGYEGFILLFYLYACKFP